MPRVGRVAPSLFQQIVRSACDWLTRRWPDPNSSRPVGGYMTAMTMRSRSARDFYMNLDCDRIFGASISVKSRCYPTDLSLRIRALAASPRYLSRMGAHIGQPFGIHMTDQFNIHSVTGSRLRCFGSILSSFPVLVPQIRPQGGLLFR
jgi:hypothetical protein